MRDYIREITESVNFVIDDDLELINEDFDENGDDDIEDKTMTDEKLKIESLKIATNIAKLMSNVTTDDIINIASSVADFIRNHEISELENVPHTENPTEEA